MAKVGILTKDQNDQLYMDYREGEIYKEFGIVETLSAGKMRGTVIHLESGRIVSDLCALAGKEVAKKHIDYTEHALRGNWDYEAIKHRFQDTIPFQAISLWGEVEVEGTFVDGFAVVRSFEAKTYDVLDIESKQIIPYLTAPTAEEAKMNIYHVHHLIHAGMPFNEIVKHVESVMLKRKNEQEAKKEVSSVNVTDVMEMHSTIVVIKQRQEKVVKLARQLLDESEHLGGVIEALEADYQLLKSKAIAVPNETK